MPISAQYDIVPTPPQFLTSDVDLVYSIPNGAQNGRRLWLPRANPAFAHVTTIKDTTLTLSHNETPASSDPSFIIPTDTEQWLALKRRETITITTSGSGNGGHVLLYALTNSRWPHTAPTPADATVTFAGASRGITITAAISHVFQTNPVAYIQYRYSQGNRIRNNPTQGNMFISPNGASGSFTITGLTASTQYTIEARLVNEFGNSDWSYTETLSTNA